MVLSINFCFSQEIGQKKIHVESTNFNAQTLIRVTCIEFEQSFEGYIKVKEIDDQDTIQKLDVFLQKVKYSRKYKCAHRKGMSGPPATADGSDSIATHRYINFHRSAANAAAHQTNFNDALRRGAIDARQ